MILTFLAIVPRQTLARIGTKAVHTGGTIQARISGAFIRVEATVISACSLWTLTPESVHLVHTLGTKQTWAAVAIVKVNLTVSPRRSRDTFTGVADFHARGEKYVLSRRGCYLRLV